MTVVKFPKKKSNSKEQKTAIIYCENNFGKIDGKTANGLVRYSEKYKILAVIDSTKAGQDAGKILDNVPNNIPVCSDFKKALKLTDAVPDSFIYGMAPLSGMLSTQERSIMLDAIKLGMNLVNGLHQFLNDDPEFVAASVAKNVKIFDVRKPRDKKDLKVFTGRIKDVTCPRIAVLGTDGAIGKRTTATILTKTLNDHGIKAVMVGTGQTGLIQGARFGIAIDAIAPQFCSGEMEAAVIEAFEEEKPDVIVIEGQGALSHPAYLTSAYILRGSRPDGVILQHAPKRTNLSDYPEVPMPSVTSEINLIETFSKTKVIGLTINHEFMSDKEISESIKLYEEILDIPATDALTRSKENLINMVLLAFPALNKKVPVGCYMSARLEINLRKIHHNAHIIVQRLAVHGISVTGITKATLGLPAIAEVFQTAGVTMLGDSRIENIEKMKEANVKAPISLIRSPMLSQIDRIIEFADTSFNTELEIIKALSNAAKLVGKTHGIVLMVELGDLREGIMPCDVEAMVRSVIKLPNIEFQGIGANLACRSGIKPDDKNMAELSALANSIDDTFGITMSIVSGGNSSNLEWVFKGLITEDKVRTGGAGRINNLRLGEAILLGRNPLDREPIKDLYTDGFNLIGEVIEVKVKPSQPWGEMAQAAFGTPPPISNQGDIHQVLLAIGEQDTDTNGLTPPSGLEILGASSDHIILNTKKSSLALGDEIALGINYSALLRSMTSPFVSKVMEE